MSDNQEYKQGTTEEVDLGKVFSLVGNGIDRLGLCFLRIFLYLKKHMLWLTGLVLIGLACGLLINFLVPDRYRLDVIVTPNLDTSDYLKDVVSEVQSGLKYRDTSFFESLGIDIEKTPALKIEIQALREARNENHVQDMEMLELLKEFQNTQLVADIVRTELQNKTIRDQRITFYFKRPEYGRDYAEKIMVYINSNEYYDQLIKVYIENANKRILFNDSLVTQIDRLVGNYTDKMLESSSASEGRLILENEEPLNIPSLLALKGELKRDSEAKMIELNSRKQAITIVNFGKPHKVTVSLINNNLFRLPLLLVLVFLLTSFFRYLNRRSTELDMR